MIEIFFRDNLKDADGGVRGDTSKSGKLKEITVRGEHSYGHVQNTEKWDIKLLMFLPANTTAAACFTAQKVCRSF